MRPISITKAQQLLTCQHLKTGLPAGLAPKAVAPLQIRHGKCKLYVLLPYSHKGHVNCLLHLSVAIMLLCCSSTAAAAIAKVSAILLSVCHLMICYTLCCTRRDLCQGIQHFWQQQGCQQWQCNPVCSPHMAPSSACAAL